MRRCYNSISIGRASEVYVDSHHFDYTDDDKDEDLVIDTVKWNGDAQTVRIPSRLVPAVLRVMRATQKKGK
jgi:hypothetical protein